VSRKLISEQADRLRFGITTHWSSKRLGRYLELGLGWSLPQRWLVGTTATWHGERFRDEANADRIEAGWALGVTAYWESADKRWIAQALLDNLRANRNASDDRATKLILRASYLF